TRATAATRGGRSGSVRRPMATRWCCRASERRTRWCSTAACCSSGCSPRRTSAVIRRIVAFALYQPLFILLGVALFIGAGLWAFNNLPVEAFPDVTDTQATVIALYPGRAAEEVEKQVTIPLEVGLSGLPGAVRMFSHTQFGLSFVIITFNDTVNGYFARSQAVERLREIDLPEGVQAQLAPFSTAIGEMYRYRMKADGQGRQQYLIRGLGLFQGVEDIENVVVAERGGTPILVKSLGRVSVGSVPRQGVAGQDADDDVVTGVVLMRRGENPSVVLKLVRDKVDRLNATGLPGGVKIVPIYDRTWL